jgi:hypothetical protein
MRAASECPGTLRELAQRSQVGYQSARDNVPKLAREGALRVVEARKVDYRNRLVHVYEVAPTIDGAGVVVDTDNGLQSLTELQRFIGAWRGESVT